MTNGRRRPRRFIAWHTELLSDLGGDENMTVQQTALVEMATRTKLYGAHLYAWLMGQESLVNRKRRRFLPVVRERQQLMDSLARILKQLGLERRPEAGSGLGGIYRRKILRAGACGTGRGVGGRTGGYQ